MKETMKAEAAELLAEMRKRSVTGTGITLSAGSNGLLVAAFDAMQKDSEKQLLSYCQCVAMHTSKVAVLGAIAIELEKGNFDAAKDWCLEALNQSDCSEWQLYQDANEFWKSHKLNYPMSVAEHRENIKKLDAVIDADRIKEQANDY